MKQKTADDALSARASHLVALLIFILAIAPTSTSSLDIGSDLSTLGPCDLAPFTIRITNSGATPLDPVRMVDTLPRGLRYVSDDRNGDASGREVTWTNLGPLDIGESTLVHLITRVDPCARGGLENLVTVTGTPPTGYDVIDSDTEDISVVAPSDWHGRDWESIEIGDAKAIALNSLSEVGDARGAATAENHQEIKSDQGRRQGCGAVDRREIHSGDQMALAFHSGRSINRVAISSEQR